jgi:hypothetical protein
MSNTSTFTPVEVFGEDERREATGKVIDNVMQVLFFFFEENEENLEDDEALDEFINYLWSISCSALAVTGMRIIGKNEDGQYVATFNPSTSVKDFMQKNDIGEDDDAYFEDIAESNEAAPYFNGHDSRFVSE